MIINKVILENWQSYKGKENYNPSETVFDVSDTKNLKSAIIYGENGFGKSAFWESIRWGMYGEVLDDDGDAKKIIQMMEGKKEDALMNHAAIIENDYYMCVKIYFNHDAVNYLLTRRSSPRIGVNNIKFDGHLKEEFTIYNEDENEIVAGGGEFINEILPKNIANFFMFDGEKLERYRELMRKNDESTLVIAIESILRLDAITIGIDQTNDYLKKVKKEVQQFGIQQVKDNKVKSEMLVHVANLEQIRTEIDEIDVRIEGFTKDRKEAEKYLNENKSTKQAQNDMDDSKKRIAEIDDTELPNKEKRRSACFRDSWKFFIKDHVKAAREANENVINRQKKQEEEINELNRNINRAEEAIVADKCSQCNSNLNELTSKDTEIQMDIINKSKAKKEKIEGSSNTPDPYLLHSKTIALNKIYTDKDLNEVAELSRDIRKLKSERKANKKKYDTAMLLTTPDAIREVTNNIEKRNKNIQFEGIDNADKKLLELEHEKIEGYISSLAPPFESNNEDGNPLHDKAIMKNDLLDQLKLFFNEILDPFKEEMRDQVEKYASNVFIKCSNKKDEYSGLRINKDFTIQIKNKDGSYDKGGAGKGQWSLIAYAMLDALTKCSHIEFPFIIDTPGRSLDNNNLTNVFEHLFNDIKRQVILLPNPNELEPEKGDKKYGSKTSKTYIIERNFKKKVSKIIVRTKEGVRV